MERAKPARRVLLAPWREVLINLEDTAPLRDLDSGKIIPIKAMAWSRGRANTRSIGYKAMIPSNTKNAPPCGLQLSECSICPL